MSARPRWRNWCIEKTAGNPFFAIQFLSALVEEGLLTFDHGAARWSWDLTRIHAKGYTDNVVDLMVGKLSRLPVNTQKALQQLACLGNSAELALLAMVYEDSEGGTASRSAGSAREPDSFSAQEMPIASFTTAFRKPPIP